MDVKSEKNPFVAISSRLIQYNDWTITRTFMKVYLKRRVAIQPSFFLFYSNNIRVNNLTLFFE